MNPLQYLPTEIVLRILEFCSISSIAKLTRIARSWHHFIHVTHQETIYASPSKTLYPPGHTARDLSFLSQATSFARYFDKTISFKDLCRRQTLLSRNWNHYDPVTRESVIQVGNDPVWRFRADFKRRFFMSTSQCGGFNVTDMDSGELLWRLSNREVRPFAHLEYEDGVAVWDREGDALEVWKTDFDGYIRGAFRRIAILQHDCQTRGFQLSGQTLCVVSTEGKGFVYDMRADPPVLRTRMEIESDAVGHLCQNEEIVMYCMGKKGYYVHDKTTGALLGTIQPKHASKDNFYHIRHPAQSPNAIISTGSALSSLPSVDVFPPKHPNRDRLTRLEIEDGSLPATAAPDRRYTDIGDDEWGAGLLSGAMMIGVSRAGRVFVCSDWEAALRDPKALGRGSQVIECESNTRNFDLGGWLDVRDHRIMFEVRDRVYVIALGEDGRVKTIPDVRPSWSFVTSSATQLAVPVSFMKLEEDCIMATYTTLGWRRRTGADVTEILMQPRAEEDRFRIFPTKTIRVLSLAPDVHEPERDAADMTSKREQSAEFSEETHAAIMEVMDMLSEDEDEDETLQEDASDDL